MGKTKRPLYDPIIEQLNDKAKDAARERTRESKLGKITDHERQSDEGRSLGLIAHGERIKADPKDEYIGSICVHVYRSPNALSGQSFRFLSQSPGLAGMSSTLAQEALKTLGLHVMNLYGVKPKATRDPNLERSQTIADNL